MFNRWVGKIPWRRTWQPTPVFLPRKFHGQKSLVGYSPQGHKESHITEHKCFYSVFPLLFSSGVLIRYITFILPAALVIANTLFQQHKKRLYTWTSPDGQHRNEIDYSLCSKRSRSSIQSTKTRPGADCGSDHELLITKFRLKLN